MDVLKGNRDSRRKMIGFVKDKKDIPRYLLLSYFTTGLAIVIFVPYCAIQYLRGRRRMR